MDEEEKHGGPMLRWQSRCLGGKSDTATTQTNSLGEALLGESQCEAGRRG